MSRTAKRCISTPPRRAYRAAAYRMRLKWRRHMHTAIPRTGQTTGTERNLFGNNGIWEWHNHSTAPE